MGPEKTKFLEKGPKIRKNLAISKSPAKKKTRINPEGSCMENGGPDLFGFRFFSMHGMDRTKIISIFRMTKGE